MFTARKRSLAYLPQRRVYAIRLASLARDWPFRTAITFLACVLAAPANTRAGISAMTGNAKAGQHGG
jgi:hypothetical protein